MQNYLNILIRLSLIVLLFSLSCKTEKPFDPNNIDQLAPLQEFTVAEVLKEGESGKCDIAIQCIRVDKYIYENCGAFLKAKKRWPTSYKELDNFVENKMDLSASGTIRMVGLLPNGNFCIETKKNDDTGTMIHKLVVSKNSTGIVMSESSITLNKNKGKTKVNSTD